MKFLLPMQPLLHPRLSRRRADRSQRSGAPRRDGRALGSRLGAAAHSFVRGGDAGEANAATGIIPADFTRRTSAVEMLSAGSN